MDDAELRFVEQFALLLDRGRHAAHALARVRRVLAEDAGG